MKEKTNKLEYIEIQNFCSFQGTRKGKPQTGRKIIKHI